MLFGTSRTTLCLDEEIIYYVWQCAGVDEAKELVRCELTFLSTQALTKYNKRRGVLDVVLLFSVRLPVTLVRSAYCSRIPSVFFTISG